MLLEYRDMACGKVTAIAELLFADLFYSLLSLDDVLNIARSVFIYFKFMYLDSSHLL